MKNDTFGRKDNMFSIVCLYYSTAFDSRSHPTDLHIDAPSVTLHTAASTNNEEATIDITSKCTQIYWRFTARSWAKIMLADVHL